MTAPTERAVTYVAKFSNGHVAKRQSNRAYSHAYLITVPNIISSPSPAYWVTGFAASEELARAGAIKNIPGPGRAAKAASCDIEVVSAKAVQS